MNFVYLFFLSFIVIAIIISLFISLKKKDKKIENILISILLLLFSYYLLYCVIFWSGQLHKVPRIIMTYYIPLSLFGPVFYLYIRKILNNNLTWKTTLLTISPFILTLILYSKLYLRSQLNLVIDDGYLENYAKNHGYYFIKYFDIFLAITTFIYSLLSLNLSIKHKSWKIKNTWLRSMNLCFLGISVALLIDFILIYSEVFIVEYDYIASFFILVLVFTITYISFINDKFENEFIGITKKDNCNRNEKRKELIKNEYTQELVKKIEDLLEINKVYRENDLTLEKLSIFLRISRGLTSKLINDNYNMSYSDFINYHRITEAKQLIVSNNEELNFNEIAYSVGFNNRITFYKAFKKVTDLSPTEFLRVHLT